MFYSNLLLLGADLGRAFSRYSRRSSSLGENWFLITIVTGIVLFWVALYYWEQYRKKQVQQGNTPAALFLELCHAHRLSRKERLLLQQVADARELSHPAVLFVDLDLLADTPECDAVAEKLFGTGP